MLAEDALLGFDTDNLPHVNLAIVLEESDIVSVEFCF
jgi:hypothetical protein